MNNRKRTALCLLGAALCVFMAFGAALALGRYPITPAALLAGDAMAVRTFTVLRLPRAVMALIGGFGLGAAGFVYQTVVRNPLARPDILGVSSGARVGAGGPASGLLAPWPEFAASEQRDFFRFLFWSQKSTHSG